MKSYLILILNGIVLMAIGTYGYVMPGGSPTSLIATGSGFLMVLFSIPVKKENALFAHIAVGFTGLISVLFFVVGFLRSNSLILIMASITLVSLVLHIADFFMRKKDREKVDISNS